MTSQSRAGVPASRARKRVANMSIAAQVFTVRAGVLIPACTERLDIPGPTPVGEGITLYIHADFAGASQALNVDVSNLGKIEGPCTDSQKERSRRGATACPRCGSRRAGASRSIATATSKARASRSPPTRQASARCEGRATAASTTASLNQGLEAVGRRNPGGCAHDPGPDSSRFRRRGGPAFRFRHADPSCVYNSRP